MSMVTHKLLEPFVARMAVSATLVLNEGGAKSMFNLFGSSSSGSGSSSGSSSGSGSVVGLSAVIAEESRKLRKLIEDQSRHLTSQRAFGDLITQLFDSGKELLNHSDLKYKLVGIAVLECLLDVELRNDDLQGKRPIVDIVQKIKQDTLDNSRIGVDSSGVVVLKAISQLLGHIARIANQEEANYLYQFYLSRAFDCLKSTKQPNPQLKLASSLAITQIAINANGLIYRAHKGQGGDAKLFALVPPLGSQRDTQGASTLWDVVYDRVPVVREAAAEALDACLQVISGRETVTDDYIKEAMRKIDEGFTNNSSDKVLGSLLICDILFSSNVVSNDALRSFMEKQKRQENEFVYRILQLFTSKSNTVMMPMTISVSGTQNEVRQKAITIVPKLASTFSTSFGSITKNHPIPNTFLNFTVEKLLEVINRALPNDKERPLAYIALGKLVVAMSTQLRQSSLMQNVFDSIKNGLQDQNFSVHALQCFAMVTNAIPSIRKAIGKREVEMMFKGGLTSDLVDCLKIVMKHVSSIGPDVQQQLLYHAQSTLKRNRVALDDGPRAGRVADLSKALGAVAGGAGSGGGVLGPSPAKQGHWMMSAFSMRPGQHEILSSQQSQNSEAQLVLALQVLASPDFFRKRVSVSSSEKDHAVSEEANRIVRDLLRVVQESVLRYLDDFNPEIRAAAVNTCAKVLDTVVLGIETTSALYSCLFQVIDRLLMVGLGDDLMEIRLAVFRSLAAEASMDRIISQTENVHCLVDGMNDESVEVRVAAMAVFSRVAQYNKLYFMPLMRVIVERLVRQLQDNSNHALRSESVQLLQALVCGAQKLIIPYLDILLSPLMTLLKDVSPFIQRSALSTIGDLSVASPEAIKDSLDEISVHLIKMLEDKSSESNQEAAIEAMGKLVSSLTMVTEEPYTRYPGLFEGIVGIIHGDRPELRLKAIRTAGLLGTVDAKVYQTQMRNFTGVELAAQAQANEDDEDANEEQLGGKLNAAAANPQQQQQPKMTKIERYYLGVVMTQLVNILRNSDPPITQRHHENAANAAISILRNLGPQAKPVLENFLGGIKLRILLPDTDSKFRVKLLNHIKSLIFIFGRTIRNQVAVIVQLLGEKCPDTNKETLFEYYLDQSLEVVESFSLKLSKPDFKQVLQAVVPLIMEILITEPHGDLLQGVGDNGGTGISDGVLQGVAGGGVMARDVAAAARPGSMRVTVDARGAATVSGQGQRQKLLLPKTGKILQKIANMSNSLGDYRRTFIPAIIRILDEKEASDNVRRDALATLLHLSNDRWSASTNLEFAKLIVHPVMRIVGASEPLLRKAALTALSCLLIRLGSEYVPYIIPVRRKLKSVFSGDATNASSNPCAAHLSEYESLVGLLLKQRPLPISVQTEYEVTVRIDNDVRAEAAAVYQQQSQPLKMRELEQAWTLPKGQGPSTTALEMWMKRVTQALVQYSPSPIIQGCHEIAKSYAPLAEELFNISFNAMWDSLFEADYEKVLNDSELIHSIELGVWSKNSSERITNALLNLIEFMDMQDKPLPIDVAKVGKRAEESNMYAKSLRYREKQFSSAFFGELSQLREGKEGQECIEALISVNNQLGLEDRAAGVLRTALNDHPQISILPLWLEKLSRWGDARKVYLEQRESIRDGSNDAVEGLPIQHLKDWMTAELGALRCSHALGEYDELASSAAVLKESLGHREGFEEQGSWMMQVQKLGANAAWMLGKWDMMDSFLGSEGGEVFEEQPVIELDHNLSFYRTIMAIHKSEYSLALSLISDTRSKLSGAISSLLSESYSRAYRAMVTMQILAELEEVIDFKQTAALQVVAPRDGRDKRHLSLSSRPQSSLIHSADIYIPRSPSYERFRDSFGDNGTADISAVSGLARNGNGQHHDELQTRKAALIRKWRGRLKWAPKEVDVYRQIIAVHTLVAEPTENLDSWIELVMLCRKEGMFSQCENILRRLGAPLGPRLSALSVDAADSGASSSSGHAIRFLLDDQGAPLPEPPSAGAGAADNGSAIASASAGSGGRTLVIDAGYASPDAASRLADPNDPLSPGPMLAYEPLHSPSSRSTDSPITGRPVPPPDPRVMFEYHKYLWSSGERTTALNELTSFLKSNAGAGLLGGAASIVSGTKDAATTHVQSLRVRCLLKRAEWMRELEEDDEDMLQTVREARELASGHYSVWHAWAVTNYDQLKNLMTTKAAEDSEEDTVASGLSSSKTSDNGDGLPAANIAFHARTGSPLITLANKKGIFTGGAGAPNTGSPIKLRKVSSLTNLTLAGLQGSASLASLLGGKGSKNGGNGGSGRKIGKAGEQIISREEKLVRFVVEAIKGFVRSITLGQGQSVANVLQDTLRLLTLWFTYGAKEGVAKIAEAEITQVAPENWLDVVPQLIARLHIKTKEISSVLRTLLTRVASIHPQALVCPISVALNTTSEEQRAMAAHVLHELRCKNPQLVLEATMVSRELLLVATSPPELWIDGLEKAAKQFNDNSKDGNREQRISDMVKALSEMHDAMNEATGGAAMMTANVDGQGPLASGSISGATSGASSLVTNSVSLLGGGGSVIADYGFAGGEAEEKGFTEAPCIIGLSTLRDISFRHAYGKALSEAHELLELYKRGDKRDLSPLHQAWEIYYFSLFQKWRARQNASSKAAIRFELHHVSRELTNAANLKLSVPGTYRPSGQVVSITRFSNTVEIMMSKQRPRRMGMLGSDGKMYEFLLKGKEDLRQDERVMQLFGLINICLDNDRGTSARELNITRYSVLPLSQSSGVIGWVHACDTINGLIRNYRSEKGVRNPDIERSLLCRKSVPPPVMGPDGKPREDKSLRCYHALPLMNKVDIFNQVLETTTGDDLNKALWLKSKTADVWVERRFTFTTSVAVMSIVGYILGLGDRHLNNLMLHKVSGRVVHIDFGDCFEVTKKRQEFPEVIPFRLTRMITKVMGASGIEGTFKATCYRVMRVLRENRDSVMAMLEAFVYDPMISWRVTTQLALAQARIPATVAGPGAGAAQGTGVGGVAGAGAGAGDVSGSVGGGGTKPASAQGTSVSYSNTPFVGSLHHSPVDLLRENLSQMMGEADDGTPDARHDLGLGGDAHGLDGDMLADGHRSPVTDRRDGGLGDEGNGNDDHDAPAYVPSTLIEKHLRQQPNPEVHLAAQADEPMQENINARALEVINRIHAKLTGRDFAKSEDCDDLSVEQQVDRLIKEATSVENLCQLYEGWCPYW